MKRSLVLLFLIIQASFSKADSNALNPEAYLYKSFADQLFVDGKKTEALIAYQWASHLDPSYGNAHYNRAIALNEMCRFAEAREALESYLNLCPKDPEALYNKGILSLYLQDFETAESALSMSLYCCKDPQFARSISKALTFLVRYQDRLKSSNHEGQKKLYQQLLAFAR
jgi:Flp pilus assembly protein TadD